MFDHYSPTKRSLAVFGALCAAALTATAATLLDDTWADGSYDEQNLPTESQWFSSGGTANLTNTGTGSMTFIPDATSSRSAITYFATNGLPVSLEDGETIKVTMEFSVTGVTSNNANSMRFALVDYSAGTRVATNNSGSADLNAANVAGYGFFTAWSAPQTRSIVNPRRRIAVTSGDLLSASGDWNTVYYADDFNQLGIENSTAYTMTFSVTRSGTNALITNNITGGGMDLNTTSGFEQTDTNGYGWFTFDAFAWRNSGADETSTNIILTRLKVEGPYGKSNPPYIVGQPVNQIVSEDQDVLLTVAAGGGLPLSYQWYFVTNSTTNLVVGGTNGSLSIANAQVADTGDYFAVVTNSLGVATSDAASVTVTIPTPTPVGVVLNDTWADGDRLNTPINSTNSLWYASHSSTLIASVGSMLGIPDSSSSRLWVGYFTPSNTPATPVYLSVGNAIEVTLVFTPTNYVAAFPEDNGLRLGLFNYVGGTRLTDDNEGDFSGSEGNGAGVKGYFASVSMQTNFTDDSVMSFRVRSAIDSVNLIGTTAAYTGLGGGPDGYTGLDGFQSGTPYTVKYSVFRTDTNETLMTVQITDGASLDIVNSEVDTTPYVTYAFDAFAIRAGNAAQTFKYLNFTQFKVEVTQPPVPPFDITSVASLSANSFAIAWESVGGRTYQVQSRGVLGSGGWVTNATVVAGGPSTSWTNTGVSGVSARYYRVVEP